MITTGSDTSTGRNPYAEQPNPFEDDQPPYGYAAYEDPYGVDPSDWTMEDGTQTDPYLDPTGDFSPADGSRAYPPDYQNVRPRSQTITDDFGNTWQWQGNRYVNTDGRANYVAPAVGGRAETQHYLQENPGYMAQQPQTGANGPGSASNGYGAINQPGGGYSPENPYGTPAGDNTGAGSDFLFDPYTGQPLDQGGLDSAMQARRQGYTGPVFPQDQQDTYFDPQTGDLMSATADGAGTRYTGPRSSGGYAGSEADGDLPSFLAAIRERESGGNYAWDDPSNTSTAGARGAYQFMPDTWAEAAQLAGVDPNDHSPQAQDAAAAALAASYYDQFGDWGSVAEAWLGGPGGVGSGAADGYGTTTDQYAQDVLGLMGSAAPDAGQVGGLGGAGDVAQAIPANAYRDDKGNLVINENIGRPVLVKERVLTPSADQTFHSLKVAQRGTTEHHGAGAVLPAGGQFPEGLDDETLMRLIRDEERRQLKPKLPHDNRTREQQAADLIAKQPNTLTPQTKVSGHHGVWNTSYAPISQWRGTGAFAAQNASRPYLRPKPPPSFIGNKPLGWDQRPVQQKQSVARLSQPNRWQYANAKPAVTGLGAKPLGWDQGPVLPKERVMPREAPMPLWTGGGLGGQTYGYTQPAPSPTYNSWEEWAAANNVHQASPAYQQAATAPQAWRGASYAAAGPKPIYTGGQPDQAKINQMNKPPTQKVKSR